MKDPQRLSRDESPSVDWEGHRRWQLTAGLGATPAQRLDWLEDAIELACACGALAAPHHEQDPRAAALPASGASGPPGSPVDEP